jgi:thioredoxin-related protein
MNWLKSITALLVIVLVTAMTPIVSGTIDEGKGITFYSGTWAETLTKAKKENKMVFIDIYASWCGPCKRLKSTTFPNASVGEYYNSNFVNFAIDAERGEGITLTEKYGITGYPTLLFVDGNGNLIAKTVGYHNPGEFLELGKTIISKRK